MTNTSSLTEDKCFWRGPCPSALTVNTRVSGSNVTSDRRGTSGFLWASSATAETVCGKKQAAALRHTNFMPRVYRMCTQTSMHHCLLIHLLGSIILYMEFLARLLQTRLKKISILKLGISICKLLVIQ